MLKYYIKFLMLFIFTSSWSQIEAQKDSLSNELRYGLRIGIDISKPIRMLIEPGYKGLELVGDYRLTRNLYVAGELGNETKNVNQDGVHFETAGSYLKLGVDYNVYDNWRGMDNLIVVGFRYGVSQHFQSVLPSFVAENNICCQLKKVHTDSVVKHSYHLERYPTRY